MAITRNLGRFAASTVNVGDAARLMATTYVSYVDAIGACFEADTAWKPAPGWRCWIWCWRCDVSLMTRPDARHH